MRDDTRPPRRRTGWIRRLVDAIDDHVTGPIDDDARRRGWTARRLPRSRTIEYRDPIWDRRRFCDACSGIGLDGARPCPTCDGSGVVTDQPVHQPGADP